MPLLTLAREKQPEIYLLVIAVCSAASPDDSSWLRDPNREKTV